MFFNTGSGGKDVFEVKLTFELFTVRGQQHSFSTHGRERAKVLRHKMSRSQGYTGGINAGIKGKDRRKEYVTR